MGFYNGFRQEDLADLLEAYDNYIGEAAGAKVFQIGWTPKCVEGFYEKEYQTIWKVEGDFSQYFFDAIDLAAKEISAPALAVAIDEFYYHFDTYDYKDKIDDREAAVAGLERDILAGKTEPLIEHLKSEMLAYGKTDCFSLAAKLIIAQMEQYQKQQEQSSQHFMGTAPSERSDSVALSCYADQVLPQTDRAELVEAYHSAQFTVPKPWAEAQAKELGFRDLDDFLDTYTWDHTDGWYEKAFHDGVLLGVNLIGNSNREVGAYSPQSAAGLTLDEKLTTAKEAAHKQSLALADFGEKSL